MAEKKISFGFSKSIKPKILPGAATKTDNSIELIKCLEGQTIKIIGEVKKEEKPLIIPLKNSTKTSAALAALQALKDTIEGNENPIDENVDNKIVDNSDDPKTLEQRAAQEILNSLKERQELDDDANRVFSLPLKVDELPLDGAVESTLNDYEDIPISQFGLAMLRGMGFKDEVKSEKKIANDEPMVRPKGLGLGADKLVKPKTLLVAPAKDEVLEFKKNACVRILLGKHKDMYGQIESLDDHSGRLLIKLALGSTKDWFNEFMVQAVSKAEYAQYGKVLNYAKYEEYKKKQEDKERLDNLKIEKDESLESTSTSKAYQRSQRRSSTPEQANDRQISSTKSHKHQQYSDKHSSHRGRSDSLSDDNRRNTDRTSKYHSSRRDSSPDTSTRKSKNPSNRKSSDDSDSDHRPKYSSSSRSSHKKTKSKKHFKSRSYSKDHRQRYHSSDEEDKHYNKKTKKSKRARSRSRDRR
ncbi:hypothetical protein HA402_012374 [Bradysia odoriphaga]|nr:hypothetical protein HA402_012374 [Bradysia odoriphaga]